MLLVPHAGVLIDFAVCLIGDFCSHADFGCIVAIGGRSIDLDLGRGQQRVQGKEDAQGDEMPARCQNTSISFSFLPILTYLRARQLPADVRLGDLAWLKAT